MSLRGDKMKFRSFDILFGVLFSLFFFLIKCGIYLEINIEMQTDKILEINIYYREKYFQWKLCI